MQFFFLTNTRLSDNKYKLLLNLKLKLWDIRHLFYFLKPLEFGYYIIIEHKNICIIYYKYKWLILILQVKKKN